MAEGGLQSLTHCTVCTESVTNHRALPCQHVFCSKCLEPLVRGRRITCPMCREECVLKPGGVPTLPQSPLLVGILDLLCVKCMGRTKDIKCAHCEKQLCQECHRACRIAVDEQVELITKETNRLSATLKLKRVQLEGERDRFEENVSAVSGQIDTRADKIVNAVREQQEQLHRQLNDELSMGKIQLTACIIRSNQKAEEFDWHVDAMKKEKEQSASDWRKYNDLHKSYKELQAALSIKPEPPIYRTTIELNGHGNVEMNWEMSLGNLMKAKCALIAGNGSVTSSASVASGRPPHRLVLSTSESVYRRLCGIPEKQPGQFNRPLNLNLLPRNGLTTGLISSTSLIVRRKAPKRLV